MRISKYCLSGNHLFILVLLTHPCLVTSQEKIWTDLKTPGTGRINVGVSAMCTTPKGSLLAGTFSGSIYRSDTQGQKWQLITTKMTSSVQKLMTVDSLVLTNTRLPDGWDAYYPPIPDLLYSRDDGITWNSFGIQGVISFTYESPVLFVETHSALFTCDLKTKECKSYPQTFVSPTTISLYVLNFFKSFQQPHYGNTVLFASLGTSLHVATLGFNPPNVSFDDFAMPDTIRWIPNQNWVNDAVATSEMLFATNAGLVKCYNGISCAPVNSEPLKLLRYDNQSLFGISGRGLLRSMDAGTSWQLLAPNVVKYPKVLWSEGNNVFIGSSQGLQQWDGQTLSDSGKVIYMNSIKNLTLVNGKVFAFSSNGTIVSKKTTDLDWKTTNNSGSNRLTFLAASPSIQGGQLLATTESAVWAVDTNLALSAKIQSLPINPTQLFVGGGFIITSSRENIVPEDSVPMGMLASIPTAYICKENGHCYLTPRTLFGLSVTMNGHTSKNTNDIATKGDTIVITYGNPKFSVDAGSTWKSPEETINDPQPAERVAFLGNRLITGSADTTICKTGCVQFTDDLGANWKRPVPNNPGFGGVHVLLTRGDQVIAACDSGVFTTKDALTWRKIGQGLNKSFGAVTALAQDAALLVVGTESGDIFTLTLDPVSVRQNKNHPIDTGKKTLRGNARLLNFNGIWHKMDGSREKKSTH